MLKKIFITLLIAPVLGFAIYGYVHLKKIKSPSISAVNAIPENALAILKCNEPEITFSHFSKENPIWNDLIALSFFQSLNNQINSIKKNVFVNKEAHEIIEGQVLYISIFKSDSKNFECLFTMNLPATISEKQITNYILKASDIKLSNKDKHPNKKGVWQIHLKQNSIYFYLKNGVFSCTLSEKIINESIKQFESGRSLLNDLGFSKLTTAAGKNVEATLFLNYKNLLNSTEDLIIKSKNDKQIIRNEFANWSSLDLLIKNSSIALNGFTCIDSTKNQYLSAIKNQIPDEISLWSQVPENTAFIKGFCLSDFNEFIRNESRTYPNNSLNRKPSNSKFNFNQYFGKQFFYVITEPVSMNYNESCFGLLKFNNQNDSTKFNQELSMMYRDENYDNDSSFIDYRSFSLRKLPQQFALPNPVKYCFEKIKEPYYTKIGDMIVLANSTNGLKKWINALLSNQSLSNNSDFKEFSNSISKKASLFEFISFARCEILLKDNLKSTFLNWDDAKKYILKKSHAGFFQVSSGKDFFYTSALIEYKACYKQTTENILNTQLDTCIYTQPIVFEDASNKGAKIFLQDAAQNIYLISHTGKIIWKKKLESKIVGKVYIVNNSKKQKPSIAFCTKNELFLINPSGESENNFPIKLESESSGGVHPFEYGKNSEMRLWVTARNNLIYNYTLDGKKAKAWKNPYTKNPVETELNQFNIKGERFVICIDNKGGFKVFDQNGKTKFEGKNPVKKFNNSYSICTSKTLASSSVMVCDSSGDIWSCNFKGEKRKIISNNISKNIFYKYHPKTNTGIVCSNHNLALAEKDIIKNQIKFSVEKLMEPSTFLNEENELIIGITDNEKNVKIYNSSCKEIEKFYGNFNSSPVFCHLYKDDNWHMIAGYGNRIMGFVLKSQFNTNKKN